MTNINRKNNGIKRKKLRFRKKEKFQKILETLWKDICLQKHHYDLNSQI